jgi:uncharacterized protein (TIGR03435 family)
VSKAALFAVSFAVLFGRASRCQQPDLPSFDVASVKLANEKAHGQSLNTSFGSIHFSNFNMTWLLTEAFKLKPYQVQGPAWLNDPQPAYAIEARCPKDTPEPRVRLMLQSLLRERFQLEVRWTKKELPVFALVAGAEGSKLTPSVAKTAGGYSDGASGPGRVTGTFSMDDLAAALSNELERPVVNLTKISGLYPVWLKWPADQDAYPKPRESATVFAALQEQLGLRLVRQQYPVDLLVVDRVEKIPVGN